MSTENFNPQDFDSRKYNLKFSIDEVIAEIPSLDMDLLDEDGYEIDKMHDSGRGRSFFCKPNTIDKPFIKYSEVDSENGVIKEFIVAWTALDENGNIPEAVGSKTAERESLPALINGKYNEDGSLKLKEVLYTDKNGFERYVFNEKNDSVGEYWFFKNDENKTKMYELNVPYFISYHKNGAPKEVWFSNPKALKFTESVCTFRHTDDHPVVLSFYENGDLEKVDYTGYVFSHKIGSESVLNFPFHSRYRFYLPSYYHFSRKNDYEYQSIIETGYFIRKQRLTEREALSMLGDWGVDVSTIKGIEQVIAENPILEETVRSLMGIMLISDAELDETQLLHSIKM